MVVMKQYMQRVETWMKQSDNVYLWDTKIISLEWSLWNWEWGMESLVSVRSLVFAQAV